MYPRCAYPLPFSELDVRKSGAPGRVIFDNPSKYPDKDTLTGGFAGGERGLRSFVETGEVRLRKPGEPGGQPISPLSIAFIVLLAGIAGAAVLTEVYDFGEGAVKTDKIQVGAAQCSGLCRSLDLSGFTLCSV